MVNPWMFSFRILAIIGLIMLFSLNAGVFAAEMLYTVPGPYHTVCALFNAVALAFLTFLVGWME